MSQENAFPATVALTEADIYLRVFLTIALASSRTDGIERMLYSAPFTYGCIFMGRKKTVICKFSHTIQRNYQTAHLRHSGWWGRWVSPNNRRSPFVCPSDSCIKEFRTTHRSSRLATQESSPTPLSFYSPLWSPHTVFDRNPFPIRMLLSLFSQHVHELGYIKLQMSLYLWFVPFNPTVTSLPKSPLSLLWPAATVYLGHRLSHLLSAAPRALWGLASITPSLPPWSVHCKNPHCVEDACTMLRHALCLSPGSDSSLYWVYSPLFS